MSTDRATGDGAGRVFILWWWDYDEAEVLGVYATSKSAHRARREWPFHMKQLPEPIDHQWAVYITGPNEHEHWHQVCYSRQEAEQVAAKPKRSDHMGISEHEVLP
jgi:predicted secreted Zn-dependent protease